MPFSENSQSKIDLAISEHDVDQRLRQQDWEHELCTNPALVGYHRLHYGICKRLFHGCHQDGPVGLEDEVGEAVVENRAPIVEQLIEVGASLEHRCKELTDNIWVLTTRAKQRVEHEPIVVR